MNSKSAASSSRDATEHTFTSELPITFVNIDWKHSCHRTPETTRRNCAKLFATVGSIVRNQHPIILCLCEVGTVSDKLSGANLATLVDTCTRAWQDECRNTTERNDLQAEYALNECYITIWDRKRVACSSCRILASLCAAQPFRRAQALWWW